MLFPAVVTEPPLFSSYSAIQRDPNQTFQILYRNLVSVLQKRQNYFNYFNDRNMKPLFLNQV